MPVSDKTAIITGAGSKRGIGRATAHALASAGWNVAILDLDEPSAKEAADEVAEQRQVQTAGIGCDVTDEGAVEAALAALDGSMPPAGALVNNRSEEHTSELQSLAYLVCRLLLEKKKKKK